MTVQTLKEYQDILYDILCVVDDICKRNHITYMLHGGTMLGAVRHHDFIPWDDDVDILVWQKDYQELCSKLREELPEHLQLVEPLDLSPNFYDFIPRVEDMRYTIHEPTEEDSFYHNRQNHVFVEIFQFAYSGKTPQQVQWTAFKHKVLYGLGMGHRYQIKSEKYTLLQKLQTTVLSWVGAKIDVRKVIKWRERLIEKQNRVPQKYCMSVNAPPQGLGRRRLFESKWYTDVTYMQFRDRQLPVPKGYDSHLTLQYGDYMTPEKNEDKYIKHFFE